MNKGVCYFNNGKKCLLRLAVSLMTLRKHYGGPVAILDGNDEPELKAIAKAGNASIEPVEIEQLRRHTAYSAKPTAISQSPFDVTLFLDADTTIHGCIEELLYLAPQASVVLTAFSDWTTGRPLMSERIRKFSHPSVEDVIKADVAAINTGVLAVAKTVPGQRLCGDWRDVTSTRRGEFIADEIAMQLAAFTHPHITLSDEWNFSPIYGKARAPRIVHYHGKKHTRPEALPYWKGHFVRAWESNFGEIQMLAHWDPALKDPTKIKELT